MISISHALVAMGCAGFLVAPLPAVASAPSSVRIEGERLSISSNGMSLLELLDSVGRRTGISFSVQGDASGIQIADSFQNLPLGRALGRILSLHSHLLVDKNGGPSGRQIDVILLGAAAGRDTQPVQVVGATDAAALPAERSAETLLSDAVSSAPAAERSTAAEALAYRAGDASGAPDYAGPLLRQMLSDPDEAVRRRTLDILKDTADELPFDALAQVAREDASADRRIQALALLVERSENDEWREPLAVALNDSEPSVRKRAHDLALDWHLELDGA